MTTLVVKATVSTLQHLIPASVVADSGVIHASVATAIITSPKYEGAYEFTPSEEAQIIPCNGTKMSDDITINPIPSEYIKPNGTITITQNDTLDVSQYASADISVPDNFAFAGGKYF